MNNLLFKMKPTHFNEKRERKKALSFVSLFALPQRMEGADMDYFVYEQGFLVKAARLNGWR